MPDIEKVIKGLECCLNNNNCKACPYEKEFDRAFDCIDRTRKDAIELLKEQQKQVKALRLLVEWAEECDFGFDQFQDEYERYKDEINDMRYIDGMVHVALRTLEDHGEFDSY